MHSKKIEYTGQGVKKRRGPIPVLTFDSQEAEITAKVMEDGLGIRHATMHVNTYRNRIGKVILGQTYILGMFQRLKPLMTSIRKIKTGSNDPDSTWTKSRLK